MSAGREVLDETRDYGSVSNLNGKVRAGFFEEMTVVLRLKG